MREKRESRRTQGEKRTAREKEKEKEREKEKEKEKTRAYGPTITLLPLP